MIKIIILLILINQCLDSNFLEVRQSNFTETQNNNLDTIDSVSFSLNVIKVKRKQVYQLLDTLIEKSYGLFAGTDYNRYMYMLTLFEANDSIFLNARITNDFDFDRRFCLGIVGYQDNKIIISSTCSRFSDYFETERMKTNIFCYKYYKEGYEIIYPAIYLDRLYLVKDTTFLFLNEETQMLNYRATD